MLSLTNTAAANLLDRVNREWQNGVKPAGGTAYEWVTRALDVAVSLSLLIVLSPLLLLVAVAIKLTSRGPVIFKQQRAGLGSRPFTMYKFRSMCVGAEEDRKFLSHMNEANGPVFKIPNDPRLTPIGRFLRRTSLDELPQLFNVLLGQMSPAVVVA